MSLGVCLPVPAYELLDADTHLKAAQEWGNCWWTICNNIQESINITMDKKHKTINHKLQQLEKTKPPAPHTHKNFYPRVVNNTRIIFNTDEMNLLSKGFKYNLSHKKKNCIETIALEAETAISRLPSREQDSLRYRVAHNVENLYKSTTQ
jgi:hypothetical protein